MVSLPAGEMMMPGNASEPCVNSRAHGALRTTTLALSMPVRLSDRITVCTASRHCSWMLVVGMALPFEHADGRPTRGQCNQRHAHHPPHAAVAVGDRIARMWLSAAQLGHGQAERAKG